MPAINFEEEYKKLCELADKIKGYNGKFTVRNIREALGIIEDFNKQVELLKNRETGLNGNELSKVKNISASLKSTDLYINTVGPSLLEQEAKVKSKMDAVKELYKEFANRHGQIVAAAKRCESIDTTYKEYCIINAKLTQSLKEFVRAGIPINEKGRGRLYDMFSEALFHYNSLSANSSADKPAAAASPADVGHFSKSATRGVQKGMADAAHRSSPGVGASR